MGNKSVIDRVKDRILWLLLVPIWFLVVYLPGEILEWNKKITKLILRIQMKLDPLPKHRKGETTPDWLKRIELKHALRYATFMHLSYYDIDYDALEEKISQYPRKRDKKTLRLLAKLVTQVNIHGQENYRLVMTRKEAESMSVHPRS